MLRPVGKREGFAVHHLETVRDVDKNSMKYHNSAVDPQPNKAGCRVIASAIYDVCAMEGEINSKD